MPCFTYIPIFARIWFFQKYHFRWLLEMFINNNMKCCCCYSCTANISIECYRIYTSVTTVFQYWCKLETSQIFQVQNAMPTDLHCLQSMNYWLLQFTMSISEFLNIAIWTARNWLQYCYIVMNSPKTNKFACGYVEYMMKILSVISNIITSFMHFFFWNVQFMNGTKVTAIFILYWS